MKEVNYLKNVNFIKKELVYDIFEGNVLVNFLVKIFGVSSEGENA